MFAGVGFVAGEAARVGVEPDALIGDEGVHIGSDTPGGSRRSEHVVIGTVDVSIDGAPSAPVTVDARAAIGAVRILAVENVSVEVRAAVDNGDVEVGDVERPDGTFTIGPDGPPDVVVLARVGRGEITVDPSASASYPRFHPTHRTRRTHPFSVGSASSPKASC